MSDCDWLRNVRPSVPDAFAPWLEMDDGEPGEGADDPEVFLVAALAALERALDPEGRERRGAFDLLAADAFLTRAAEVALDGEAPGETLRHLARRVASAGRGEDG